MISSIETAFQKATTTISIRKRLLQQLFNIQFSKRQFHLKVVTSHNPKLRSMMQHSNIRYHSTTRCVCIACIMAVRSNNNVYYLTQLVSHMTLNAHTGIKRAKLTK